MTQKAEKVASDRERVLTHAVLKTAEHLAMRDRDLAEVLGLSPGMISKMRNHGATLEDNRHPFQLAAALVRVYRSLAGIVGQEPAHIRAWFHAPNHDLDAAPADLVRHPQGLFTTLQYLDSHRAVI